MSARPRKGSKRNPLTVMDMPFRVERAANYWVEVEGEMALTGRVNVGEMLSLEINPQPGHRVVGEIA